MSFMKYYAISLVFALPLGAEHGGTANFEKTTTEYFAMAKTPIRNQKINFGWAENESQLFYKITEENGNDVVMAWDLAKGTESKSSQNIPALPEAQKEKSPQRAGYDGNQSNDNQWEVLLRNGSVILKDRNTNAERVLAKDNENGAFSGKPYWSPDSKKFLLWQKKEVAERIIHYTRSSPEKQLHPEHFAINYTKPGDELSVPVPWIFYTDGSNPLEPDRSLLANPFEIRKPAWRSDSERLTYEFIERGFGKLNVIEINAARRKQRVLIREESDTFVYVYGYAFRCDLREGEEILWNSERDGWNHLYLMDGKTGAVKKQLTKGEWVVKKVLQVNEETRTALLQVCGYYPTQDPYFEHYVMVHIDTGKIIPLTASAGDHKEPVFSTQNHYYVCSWSRIDHAPVYELRRTSDGSLITTLSKADDREMRKKWNLPEPFVAKDREGKFDIFGVIIKPPNFDASKKYPVVEAIYAGPHDAHVNKSWSPWMPPMHEIAVHGFIVVQIDGRGTAHRGKEFHHFCYKNLKDAGLPDRIAWMKKAAESIPQMDLSRVGIFGGSAGGQNALGALLFHGDFYKAAAADCGCHDNRMDKIWWNEQWMDWPVGPQYADNSNVTHAKNLQGALLLTVGEVDTNVDPSSTMQVVNALIKADKDFEFIVVPNGKHGVGESRHLQRKRVDFFQRHLGAAIPMP
jgi:dipeptidyl aminopeptidase/acylaminoacyl peptidase